MADPITTSTSDSLQSSLWCVEKSTGKKAKFYQNSLYTDVVLFFFSFFLKTSAISGEEKKKSSSPATTHLRWRSINYPLWFIFYQPRSTSFEEEIEGLWTGYTKKKKEKKEKK